MSSMLKKKRRKNKRKRQPPPQNTGLRQRGKLLEQIGRALLRK
jgi:hypothetical protein